MQRYLPGLFDRLIDQPHAGSGSHTLEHLKDSIARDLEALLNTRTALPDELLAAYPEVSRSVLNYGLIDFASMCMTSDVDQKKICAAVKLAIERHEPRLHMITAALRVHKGVVNRIDFLISARFKAYPTADLVHFDAVLEPSSQQYSILKTRSPRDSAS
ncbi:MAG: type VI secretion system baseplate subunit TssE [Telluria sp.]|nr:type VI secretion system baseplate subunit TssE [Telluria sp.]